MVERQIVVLVVEGSSPFVHPFFRQLNSDNCFIIIFLYNYVVAGYAFVAQLDRVADFESVGRRFESCRTR